MVDIAFYIFALIFRTSGPKMAIFSGIIGGKTPTNSFLLWGSTEKCGRESDDTRTDRGKQILLSVPQIKIIMVNESNAT